MDEGRIREIIGLALSSDGRVFWRTFTTNAEWIPGWAEARLSGSFTADELEAIAAWMRLKA